MTVSPDATLEGVITNLRANEERAEAGQSIAEEADLLSKDLRSFVRHAWPILEPPRWRDGELRSTFRTNWHIDAICDHLEAARALEIRRLLINIPPRHMKSLTVSVFWPAWRWTFEQELRFLTFSYADHLAQRDATKSRDVLRSRWFRERWPQVELKRDVNRLDRYENLKGGHRIAERVGAGTGEGGDVLIIDDPHNAAEVSSPTMREKVLKWHSNTASTRFNDPETGVQVIVMQRLDPKDLSGYVLEQEDWTHLCLPARYNPKIQFTWPEDPRTEVGELLWPEHISQEELDRLQKPMAASDIAGQFQQIPAPLEGDLLKAKDWRYYSRELSFYAEYREFDAAAVAELRSAIGRFDMIVSSWDTSLKDRATSDAVSGGAWGFVGANGYLLRRMHGQMSLNATLEAMLEMGRWLNEMWSGVPTYHVIETAANGPAAIKRMKKQMTGVIARAAESAKGLRAKSASPALEGHNCFLPGEMLEDGSTYDPAWTPKDVQEFVEHCNGFRTDPAGKSIGGPDDDIDMWSQAMNFRNERGSTSGHISMPEGQIGGLPGR